jgi:hypothetical protein
MEMKNARREGFSLRRILTTSTHKDITSHDLRGEIHWQEARLYPSIILIIQYYHDVLTHGLNPCSN